jgi:hypothetical protein
MPNRDLLRAPLERFLVVEQYSQSHQSYHPSSPRPGDRGVDRIGDGRAPARRYRATAPSPAPAGN